MYCLTNICYVCLKKKNNLISSVNSSVSVNEELRRIIGYYTFNLPWLKTKRIILTCEECYSLLRETYLFLKMWHKNSTLVQGYLDLLNTTTMSDNTGTEAELHVHVTIKQPDIEVVKREVKLEDEHVYSFKWEHNIETDDELIIEDTKDLLVNLEESSVQEDNNRLRDEVSDTEDYPMDYNCAESIDNESDSETSFNENSDLTNTDGITAEFTGKQMHTRNKNDLNTAPKKSYKCSTCSKSFSTKTELNVHTRIHADKKSYECAICKKRYNQKMSLVVHMRVHTGEKPYECTTCTKCFICRSHLICHMRIHTGEKPYKCATCKKCFICSSQLIRHKRTHTGEKPYECATCKKCFICSSQLIRHMRTHTGEKPYECATCKKRYTQHSTLVVHMRTHTGEKPYECATCKKCFNTSSHLIRHMRTHTGEKPYECATCKKCFTNRSRSVAHMPVHTSEKPYKCSKCTECFGRKSSVKSHMRNKHRDDEPPV